MLNGATVLWRSVGNVICHEYDDALLVFHEPSGETHLMAGVSKSFLEYCCSGAIFSLDDLLEWAGQTNGDKTDVSQSRDLMLSALAEISKINLIETIRCEYVS